jgi:hypothetical protein
VDQDKPGTENCLKMKNVLAVLILFNFCTGVIAQKDTISSSGTALPAATNSFAISLTPNLTSIVTYAVISENYRGQKSIIILSRQSFFLQITGMQSSKANPNRKDMIKEHGIESPATIDDFWKLRYNEYPYKASGATSGWAKTSAGPSEGQWQVLNSYGIKTFGTYCYGENLYRLLKSMEDPNWRDDYKSK